MSDVASPSPIDAEDFGHVSFIKTFVLPAFWLLLVPIVSLVFFTSARIQFDESVRQAFISEVKADQSIPMGERLGIIAQIEDSDIRAVIEHPDFGKSDGAFAFDYAQIRWCIRISVVCLVSAVAVLVLGGVSVLFSLRSQTFQLYSLAVGWHVLRLFGAFQVLLQGILLVGLSYWVTALWFNIYIPKLIFLAVIAASAAVFFVIAAIFKKPYMDFAIEGEVITPETSMPLWDELKEISAKVGTEPPDQIVAGIDDSFFVTEQPITIGNRTVTGRTLYVSLSLLKQLDGREADAVMAHEMAHFSGNDTVYSKKIAPMMARFDNYLGALNTGVITQPVFYFMLMFRGLYELSLGRQSRQREFRADGIAATVASPEMLGSALLRIIAYAKYRGDIEAELFEEREALVTADIANRIENGFASFAESFVGSGVEELANPHPFDSHPPLEQRLAAVGVSVDLPEITAAVQSPGDGRWFHSLTDAASLEKKQWNEYEDRFRAVHEQSLCYRYLPSNDDERELVARHFPPVSYEAKKGDLSISLDTLAFEKWDDPVPMEHIKDMSVEDGVLYINRLPLAGKKQKQLRLKLNQFGRQSQVVLDTINNYFTRYKVAEEFLKEEANKASNT